MAVTVETLTADAIRPHLPVLAWLCTTVFREWPHLYDGDGSYDAGHLQTLAGSSAAMLLIAYDGEMPIGASTCLPLVDTSANVQAPFIERGWRTARFFYFAESVILREYRGRGIGKTFFALREQHARAVSDCDFTCFCTIQRPHHHPDRPAGAVPLDSFWQAQGYAPVPALQCKMAWREIGQIQDSEVRLMFWIKSLTGAQWPLAETV